MRVSKLIALVLFSATLSLLAGLPSSLAREPATGKWELVEKDDGITVKMRPIPGQELPAFQGEIKIAAPMEKIIAVVKDRSRHTEWMHNCVAAKMVKDLGAGRSIDYNRTEAPWPVWDRDVVLEAEWTTSTDGKTVTLKFHNAHGDLVPLPDKTVRMPRLVGFYEFTKQDDGQTRVVYQVEADTGGSLPTWLATRVARDLPYHTLDALRKRVTGKK